jgi:hypothetical protein
MALVYITENLRQDNVTGILERYNGTTWELLNGVRVLNQSGNITAPSRGNTHYYYSFIALGELTLPTALDNTDTYQVKNSSDVNITVVFTGGENADGSSVITLLPYESLTFISNNINYEIN